ncbi:MAG: hypothetical protein KatS3mg016_0446 [Fimbriimonadales bacterium]|nr:MAG: hypothetical protein KatS3mg016_0446 [Fimbriimonadales bacterium]GIW61024.1 MAG: hypothetical protein KatS3mg087_2090 [Patescibacteria group bacterium]
MIDLIVWSAVFVVVWAMVVAGLHWKQIGVITPFSGFLLASIVFVMPGFIYFYFFYDKVEFVQNALLNALLGLAAATAGGFLAESQFIQPSYQHWKRPLGTIQWCYSPRTYLITALTTMVLVSTYFILLGYIPLLEGIRILLAEGFKPGLVNTPRIMRDIYVNPDAQYIPLQGMLEALRYVGMIIVCIWFVHWYRIGYRRRLALLILLAAVFWLVATGQRWPLLHLLAACLIYFSVVLPRRQFKRIVFTVAMAGMLVGTVLTALLGRTNEQLTSLLEVLYFGGGSLVGRVLYGNAIAPVLSFDLFPNRYSLLYGDSYLQNLISYLPGPYPSFPVTFYMIVIGDTRGFTAPPDFYTEAYLNFGYIGTVLISFLFGVVLVGVTRIILPLLKTLIGLSLYTTMTLYLSMTSSTGIAFFVGWIIVAGAIVGLSQVIVFIECFGQNFNTRFGWNWRDTTKHHRLRLLEKEVVRE